MLTKNKTTTSSKVSKIIEKPRNMTKKQLKNTLFNMLHPITNISFFSPINVAIGTFNTSFISLHTIVEVRQAVKILIKKLEAYFDTFQKSSAWSTSSNLDLNNSMCQLFDRQQTDLVLLQFFDMFFHVCTKNEDLLSKLSVTKIACPNFEFEPFSVRQCEFIRIHLYKIHGFFCNITNTFNRYVRYELPTFYTNPQFTCQEPLADSTCEDSLSDS